MNTLTPWSSPVVATPPWLAGVQGVPLLPAAPWAAPEAPQLALRSPSPVETPRAVRLVKEEPSLQVLAISAEQRLARFDQIKAAAAARGIATTAFLLAGIAQAETGLAHCWSEATWACKGPNSVDCDNGPVIAGSGDGPCNIEQGGLGMFQFDAGTYASTLKKYGEDVLTVAGNVSHAIDYVLTMVRVSSHIPGVENEEQALAWLNNFDFNDANQRDQWIATVTHYYNGCKPTAGCWNQRYGLYNGALNKVVAETGLDYWATPVTPPEGGDGGEETPTSESSGDGYGGLYLAATLTLAGAIWVGLSVAQGKPFSF